MSSTLSSVFSRNTVADDDEQSNDSNLYDIITSNPAVLSTKGPILSSAFNICYRNALLSLHSNLEELEKHPELLSKSTTTNSLLVNESDFDVSLFPKRSYSPSELTKTQWRHESFVTEKFLNHLYSLVSQNIHTVVKEWTETELNNEIERNRRNKNKRTELEAKLDELNSTEIIEDISRLYELSGNSHDVIMEHIDWKRIITRMRSDGGFKYFDENSLRRFWIHRCQYGVNNKWSDDEDQLLDKLVEQFGLGKWIEICQDPILQRSKKSAYMCAQRYMTRVNTNHSNRPLAKDEKEQLLSIYQRRCRDSKDYRFCISYAAYIMGDRSFQKINRVWTYLTPDIKRGPFSPEEDAILLQHGNSNGNICWSLLASKYLPERSAIRCRQRYLNLVKTSSTKSQPKTRKPRVIYTFITTELREHSMNLSIRIHEVLSASHVPHRFN